MIKHLTYILFISIAILLLQQYLADVLNWLASLQSIIMGWLRPIFANGVTGRLIKGSIVLLTVPLIVTFVPAGIYFMINRERMPYTYHVLWGSWLVFGTLFILK